MRDPATFLGWELSTAFWAQGHGNLKQNTGEGLKTNNADPAFLHLRGSTTTSVTPFIMIEVPSFMTFMPAESGKLNEIDCRTGIPGKKITCVHLPVTYNNYGDTTSTRMYYRNTLFIDFSAFEGGEGLARAIIPTSNTAASFPTEVNIAAIDRALHLIPEDESWRFKAMTYIKLRTEEQDQRSGATAPAQTDRDYTLTKNDVEAGQTKDKWPLVSTA